MSYGYGMNDTTGQPLTGLEELRQRVQRCIRTRKGTLVGRRNYGSRLPEKVDNRMSPYFRLDIYSAVDEMFRSPDNGLSDFQLKNTQISAIENEAGITVTVTGVYLPEKNIVKLEGVLL